MSQDDRESQGVANDDPLPGGAASPPGNELVARLKQIGEELAELFRDGARLIGAESRLFASSLLLIMALAVALGFLLAGVLLLCGVVLVLLLVRYGGLDPVIAVLIVMLGLIGLAAGIVVWIKRLTRHLRFRESRRMLSRISTGALDSRNEEAR